MKSFFIILTIFFSLYIFPSHSSDATKISVPADIDRKSLCPTNISAFGHVVVVLDMTEPYDPAQRDFISSEVFSEQFYMSYPPFTKFSYILINHRAPQSQEYIVSVCRTKTGTPTSYQGDMYTSNESKMYVTGFWKKFLKKVAVTEEKIFDTPFVENARGSLIYETINLILTSSKFEFTRKQKNRELIIVSDMMQNSDRISFYKFCKDSSIFQEKPNHCPSFEELMSDASLRDYFDSTSARNETIPVKVLYMNRKYQTLRSLDKSLVQLWKDYFRYMGFTSITVKRSLDY
jgi:hypothetical protein